MEKCLGNTFILNDQLLSTEEFGAYCFLSGFSVYEIIRFERGIAIFLEDHLARLFHSIKLENLSIKEDPLIIRQRLKDLIDNNDVSTGKIKLIINFFDYPERDRYNFLMFFTEYSFPDSNQYKNGVKAIFCSAVRKDPNAKVLGTEARKTADQHIQDSDVYEAFLVERDGSVTEGSRSNIFAIKGCRLITPPDDSVLQGIARKKVIELCNEHQIEIEFRKIHKDEFKEFEAVFITGTSPRILPVKQVVDLILPVKHELLEFLMVKYNEKIEGYIESR